MAEDGKKLDHESGAAPIGVFDSGVGGLSVVRNLLEQLPSHPLIYLADQANTPYGQRSLSEIRTLAEEITRFLLAQGARVIVIACNTASAAALHELRTLFPETPFVGMEPAVKPATEHTRNGHVGVIATQATFQGELFASLLDRFANGITVHTQVCPLLVPYVEAGELDTARTRAAIHEYLAPLLAAGIDQLVLGCTHYPFLRAAIERETGPGIEIIDPAPAVARQTARVLSVQGWSRHEHSAPSHRYYTSSDPVRLRSALELLLQLNHPTLAAHWSSQGELQVTEAPTAR